MLNDFRRIDITWDRANKRIYDPIQVSSSDEDGRKLVVQVLNGNQVEDLTGASLNLYWETKSKHYRGLDLFDVIDAKKGLFELYFTTGMLSNIGQLNAHLYLIGDGAVTSEPFKIRVLRGVNTDTVESSNSFSTLSDALARVVNIESDEILRREAEVLRESTFLQSETSRDATFLEGETARDNAETNRSNEYTQAQLLRTSLYENAEADRYDLFETAELERESGYATRAESLEATYAPRLTGLEDAIGSNGIEDSGYIEGQGHWVQYKDGRMECYGTVYDYSGDSNWGTDTGITFFKNTSTTDFPKPFVDVPFMFCDLVVDDLDYTDVTLAKIFKKNDGFSLILSSLEPSPPYVGEHIYDYFAIGRWK